MPLGVCHGICKQACKSRQFSRESWIGAISPTFANRAPSVALLQGRPVADLAPIPPIQQLLVRVVCEDLHHLLLRLAIELGGFVGFLINAQSLSA